MGRSLPGGRWGLITRDHASSFTTSFQVPISQISFSFLKAHAAIRHSIQRMMLCPVCSSIDFIAHRTTGDRSTRKHHASFDDIISSALTSCELCALIINATQLKPGLPSSDPDEELPDPKPDADQFYLLVETHDNFNTRSRYPDQDKIVFLQNHQIYRTTFGSPLGLFAPPG